jgi:hypothetical protein
MDMLKIREIVDAGYGSKMKMGGCGGRRRDGGMIVGMDQQDVVIPFSYSENVEEDKRTMKMEEEEVVQSDNANSSLIQIVAMVHYNSLVLDLVRDVHPNQDDNPLWRIPPIVAEPGVAYFDDLVQGVCKDNLVVEVEAYVEGAKDSHWHNGGDERGERGEKDEEGSNTHVFGKDR